MDPLIPILLALLAVPSVSSDHVQCRRALDMVRELLPQDRGLVFEQFEWNGVPSLVVRTRPGRHAALVLNAHLDVVPGRPEQFRPRVEGSRVHGRGAYDMKGVAAVYVQFLHRVAALPVEKRPDLQVQFVTDEEVGGEHGSRELQRLGFTGDLFIAGEPTDLAVCNRAKGPLWLTLHQSGRPGHGSRPWEADNALLRLVDGLSALLRLHPVPSHPEWRTTVTPSAFQSGDAHNRVPGEAVLKLDIRRVAQDSEASIMADVRRCFPQARIEVVQSGSPLDTSESNPRVHALAQAMEAVRKSPTRFRGEHFASDARYWAAAGVPAVCWGAVGGGIHGDDEWVDVDSLWTCYQVLCRLTGVAP